MHITAFARARPATAKRAVVVVPVNDLTLIAFALQQLEHNKQ